MNNLTKKFTIFTKVAIQDSEDNSAVTAVGLDIRNYCKLAAELAVEDNNPSAAWSREQEGNNTVVVAVVEDPIVYCRVESRSEDP